MRKTLLSTAALALAGGAVVAFPASAATIYIGLQEAGVNGGAITTVASSGAATGPFFGSNTTTYGVFTIRDVNSLDSGTDPRFPNFASTAVTQVKTAQATAKTLTVWITETGIPGGVPTNLPSALTSVTLSSGFSATETTYYTPGDVIFGTGTTLLSAGFTAGGQAANGTTKITTANPYSLTEEFVITVAKGHTGQSRLGEAITATSGVVPEPSTWAMMVFGFIGLGYAAFRRSSKSRAVAI